MRKIISPCGLHCIKVNHLGVRFNDQVVLEDINLHIHGQKTKVELSAYSQSYYSFKCYFHQ